ncbi:MAG: hypothetical protein ACTSYO_08010 [Candidatus Ranarchaeia archaeon]
MLGQHDVMNKKIEYLKLQEEKTPNAPLCKCGCGKKVKWCLYTHKYKTYLFNHNQPQPSKEITSKQEQIIRGTVLGDGNIGFLKNRRTKAFTGKARLRTRHGPKQLPYILWLRKELNSITASKIVISKNKGFGKITCAFSTLSHPKIFEIGQTIYLPKKQVTYEFLETLDDLSLTVWWMDDGAVGGMLSTHSFTVKEHQIMIEWFNQKYKIIPTMNWDKKKNLPFLSIKQPYLKILREIIKPHIIPSMEYKLQSSKKLEQQVNIQKLMTSGLIKFTTSSPTEF